MKSLRFMRLSSLQEENFIKIVYGKNRKFSGYVTDNDHKKSLELLNKKGELLVIEYSEIKSFIIKNKTAGYVTAPKINETVSFTVKNSVADKVPEAKTETSVPEKSEETEEIISEPDIPPVSEPEPETFIPEVPKSADFFSRENYIQVPEINRDYIANLYNGIDNKEIKIIVTRYFNSFMAGDKSHQKDKCISAVAGFRRDFPEYSEDKNAVRLLAFMYAYNEDFDNACDIFTNAEDYRNAALYAYLSGNYESALLYSYIFINSQLQNSQKYPENVLYILIRSSVETDNAFYISELVKNYPCSGCSDEASFEGGLDYLLYKKNVFQSESLDLKLIRLKDCYNFQRYEFDADIKNFPNDVMFGHIFDVNGLTCSIYPFSSPGKKYTFYRSSIKQKELSEKLSDDEQDVTRINVAFNSRDGQNALNVREISFAPETMANLGMKYFEAKNYKSALDCFFGAFNDDEQKEEMFFHIVQCYLSLAKTENKSQNYKSLKKFADKYGSCVSDKYRLNEIYFNIFKETGTEKQISEYLELLIENAESSEKKLIYIRKKAEMLYQKNLFAETLDVLNSWTECFNSSDSVIQELYSETEKNTIIPLIDKCKAKTEEIPAEETFIESKENIAQTPETAPEPEEIIPQEEETVLETEEIIPEPEPEVKSEDVSQQNQEKYIVMPYERGILPEPENKTEYSVKFFDGSENYDVKKCCSELKKFFKKRNRDKFFIQIFIQRIIKMVFFSENVLKLLLDLIIEERKENNYNSVDEILLFFYSTGMLGKIVNEPENSEKYYFITKKGADVLNKDDIKKEIFPNISKENRKRIKISSFVADELSPVQIYINHYGIISEAIAPYSRKYIIDSEKHDMIYFRANAVIFRNRSVPCANAKDECVFMILTPDIKADTDEELYRKCVKKFAEILKIKTEKLKSPDKFALAVISGQYGAEWNEIFTEFFGEYLSSENLYASCENNKFIDCNGNILTAVEIISAMLSENPPEKSDETAIPENISEDDETEEDEIYSDFMNKSPSAFQDSEKISSELNKMLCSGQYGCALTYIKAVSEMNENYRPFYKLMSMALDNPAEKCLYTSGSIFDIPKTGEFSETEMYEYCMTACKLRAVYYSDCFYDYSINSFAEDIKRSSPAETYPELKTLTDILSDFRKEFNIGMDSFSDYCMKDKLCVENGINKIQSKAVELYKRYCNSSESYSNLRVKRFTSIIYSEKEELMNILNIACEGNVEKCSEAENFLMENFIRDKGNITSADISEDKISRYIKRAWDESLERIKASKKTVNSSDELSNDLRNHSANVLRKIATVLCEWTELAEQGNQFTSYEKAYEKYQQKRGTVLGILNELIMSADMSNTAPASVLGRTLRDICERIDGSYDYAERKYYFIDFLKSGYVTLDSDGIPDLSSKFCSLEGFSITDRIIKHASEKHNSLENRLEEIFSKDISNNDYGSAVIINEYLSLRNKLSGNYSEKIEKISEYCRFSEQKILNLKNSFAENMELADCKGQFYQRESLKKLVLKVADIWYKKCCSSHNYGFYSKLLESLENMILKESENLKAPIKLKLDELKGFYDIPENDFRKISSAVERYDYTVALSYMSLIAKGQSLTEYNTIPEDFLSGFWSRYSENYRKCTDEVFYSIGSNLIPDWIADEKGTGEKRIESLLEKLGWKNCKAVSKGKTSGNSERFLITAENDTCPVSVFRNSFDVLCIFEYSGTEKLISGFANQKNNTLVFLDYALTESERRHIARKIKASRSVSKAFPIIDRVVISYLEQNYSENNINNMLMSLIMPFAKFQPYEISQNPENLTPLNVSEGINLVVSPMRYMGIYFDSPETVSLILADSNYCPQAVNYWCYALVESLCCEDYAGYNEISSPPYIVTESHIKKILGNKKFRNGIKNIFLDMLGNDESGIYYSCAVITAYLCCIKNSEYGYTPDEIRLIADSYWIKDVSALSEEKLLEVLDNLCNMGIFVKGFEKRYFFFRENFCGIIGSQNEIEDKLLKYME